MKSKIKPKVVLDAKSKPVKMQIKVKPKNMNKTQHKKWNHQRERKDLSRLPPVVKC